MPGGWWSECACKCVSHVVMYNTALSAERLFELHLVEGFVTSDDLLSAVFRHVMTLRTSHPPRLSYLFFVFFLPQRRERWTQAWHDRPVMNQSKEAWPNSSIIHLTSPNTISINSIKTHLYAVRNTSFNRCDVHLLQANSIISISQLEILFAEHKGTKSVVPLNIFHDNTLQCKIRAGEKKKLGIGPKLAARRHAGF